MGSLQDKLAAAQKAKATGNSPAPQQQQMPRREPQAPTFREADLASLDDMVFGAPDPNDNGIQYEYYPNGQKREIYDPNRELEEIKNGQTNYRNPNAHLPNAILEEIMRNPLDIQPIEDPTTELMTENVQARSLDIIGKLEERDNSKRQQPVYEASGAGTNVDMQQLAQLIESIVDKKLRQYSSALLTESKKSATPALGLMTIGDKFRLMDKNGAIYECQMKYVGQGKMKKK